MRRQYFGTLHALDPMMLHVQSDIVVRIGVERTGQIMLVAANMDRTAKSAGLCDSSLALVHDTLAVTFCALKTNHGTRLSVDVESAFVEAVTLSTKHVLAMVQCLEECLGEEHSRSRRCRVFYDLLNEANGRGPGQLARLVQRMSMDSRAEDDSGRSASSAGAVHWSDDAEGEDYDKFVEEDHDDDGRRSEGAEENDGVQSDQCEADATEEQSEAEDEAPWETCKSSIHGRGMAPKKIIKASELILSEPVTLGFAVPGSVLCNNDPFMAWLPQWSSDWKHNMLFFVTRFQETYQHQLRNLHDFDRALEIDPDGLATHLSRTMAWLCHPFGIHKTGTYRLFYCAALLNHSCVPNAEAGWNPETRRLNVYALKNIPKGEEILIPYINIYQAFADRVRLLPFNECQCKVCQ